MTVRAADPRSIRTVTALRHALREGLQYRSLDDLSVSELCRLADVRRTTFYTHYASAAELLTEMLTTEIDDLLGLPDVSELSGLSTERVAAEFQHTLIAAFGVVTADRALFRIAFESDASALLRRSLTATFSHRLEIALAIWQQHGEVLEVDVRVAVPFAAGGLAASIEAWALCEEDDAVRWADSVRDQMPPWWPRA